MIWKGLSVETPECGSDQDHHPSMTGSKVSSNGGGKRGSLGAHPLMHPVPDRRTESKKSTHSEYSEHMQEHKRTYTADNHAVNSIPHSTILGLTYHPCLPVILRKGIKALAIFICTSVSQSAKPFRGGMALPVEETRPLWQNTSVWSYRDDGDAIPWWW